MSEDQVPRATGSSPAPRGGAATPQGAALERAVKLYHGHRYEQALSELEAAGDSPERDYYLGLALTQLGRHDEAVVCLEKVVASHFSFLHIIQAHMVLGYLYSVTGRFGLAEMEFGKVSEMGLQSSQALAALGYVYYAQRKVPESIDTLTRAVELDPRNANALNSLGFIYAEEKIDLGKALSCCRQAVEIAPRNAAYLDSLGWTQFRMGSHAEARTTLRRALDLAPGNREIAGHLRASMDALKET